MKTVKHGTPKHRSESGQGFVEYAIILILVGIAVVAVVALMQPAIGDVFSRFVAQAPVAPPSLLNYTPPPTFTSSPTVDPNATNTSVPPAPTNTSPPPAPSSTPITPTPSNTPITPTPSNTPSPTPCGYGAYSLPANSTIRVQMEQFRCGGAGVAFQESGNDGGPGSGAFRNDVGSQGPDLENTTDVGGGYNVGWVADNEWIEYQINVTEARAYDFIVRNASINTSNPRIRITVRSGALTYDSGVITLGPTNGWQDWTNDTVNQVQLYPGINIVRFTMVTGLGNYNYFDIRPYIPTPTPTPVTPTATPIPTNTPTSPPPVTLTLYSNATHDGYIRENGTSGQGDPGQTNNTSSTLFVGDNNGSDNEQYVSIVSFNTAAIPANATITSVQLRLQQRNNQDGTPFGDFGLGVLYADIAPTSGFGGNYALQASDFQAAAAVNNVITLSSTANNNDWSTGSLGAVNFNRINRNGFTQFKIHFQLPDDGDGSRDRVRFDSADAGTNNQPPAPELVIIYTVP